MQPENSSQIPILTEVRFIFYANGYTDKELCNIKENIHYSLMGKTIKHIRRLQPFLVIKNRSSDESKVNNFVILIFMSKKGLRLEKTISP